jgi:CRISPR-associated protein Csm3
MMEIKTISGQIELLSGLHIGGGDDTMKIGGIDNSVIKDVNTNYPYIPGSSLKGKMRSLLEWHYRLVNLPNADGKPFSAKLLDVTPEENRTNAENLLKLFGDAGENNKFGITRISVGDCALSDTSEAMVLSEAKFENVIDRQKGTAQHPRQTERVPAGVRFDFDIRVKIFDEDDGSALMEMVGLGIDLVEKDYLGGSGSRGYGRVKFHING